MIITRSEVTEDARTDLQLHYEWYLEKADDEIADRYLKSFQHTLSKLVVQPDLGVVRRFRSKRLQGIRSIQFTEAFRVHLLFYRLEEEALVVFRVMHGMRDLPRRLLEHPGSE
ncbi:MAG: type II toxin-antitoxin system RelE/ParE family toxin [Verrucomicrobiota bacterium]